ncbi:MCE family protein [Nocardioides panzhihuensis]|uniref:Phospholipid/cholesterol/gamma-HCH transport system substrate-binding protein n=1 Tax=Nocardioides panzhihuensis TaxID=860243 RepID=A0A7Z0DH57_9ACTN|nr:MCE family protein [Nocardioides panzhihuensis]NYI75505.1 phospholipid/cholesterol/gamma-HCH transport system substrate-binding protein [Nocardioides panzhihuensis]
MRTRLPVMLTVVLLTAGCGFTGINDLPLPLTKGSGDGSYEISVHLANATNLVPNSEVKVDDVTVGSVRRIELDHWHAKLTLGLEKDVRLPAATTARIGQKSLLGAEYLQLDTAGLPKSRLLADGDVIPLGRTGRYPETEEVLSALGAVLTGGGLEQIHTITRELNAALGGREGDVRSLVERLDTFVGTLEDQKQDIVAAVAALDRLAATFNDQTAKVDQALTTLPKGVEVLRRERDDLTRALEAVASFSATATEVIDRTHSDLEANLADLRPTLGRLADSGKNLTQALGDISFPFPIDASQIVFRGDYINFFATVDLTLDTIERDWLGGTPLDGLYSAVLGSLPAGTSAQAEDPLTGPVDPNPPPALDPAVEDLQDLLEKLGSGSGVDLGSGTKPPKKSGSGSSPSPSPKTGGGGLLDGLLGGGTS